MCVSLDKIQMVITWQIPGFRPVLILWDCLLSDYCPQHLRKWSKNAKCLLGSRYAELIYKDFIFVTRIKMFFNQKYKQAIYLHTNFIYCSNLFRDNLPWKSAFEILAIFWMQTVTSMQLCQVQNMLAKKYIKLFWSMHCYCLNFLISL